LNDFNKASILTQLLKKKFSSSKEKFIPTQSAKSYNRLLIDVFHKYNLQNNDLVENMNANSEIGRASKHSIFIDG
jgi:hypothetical protein